MSDETQNQIDQLNETIAGLEALPPALRTEQVEATLASLRRQRDGLLQARVEGGGAAAQAGSTAVGERGVNVGGNVEGDIITGTQITQHVTDPSKPKAQALREQYLADLLATSGHLSLEGIDPKAAGDRAARLNLGAVYTALMTHSFKVGRYIGRAQDQPVPDEKLRLSALNMLNQRERLVLLGDPGSGKSTFVNFVTLCLAGEALEHTRLNLALLTAPLPQVAADGDNDRDEDSLARPQPWKHGALLPVRVILREFAARELPPPGEAAGPQHLWHFVGAELERKGLLDYLPFLKNELRRPGGIFLFDGLDEVPEAERRREQIKQVVEGIANTHPRCRILVTSRTYAYQEQNWRLAGFEEAVLAPFNAAQIARFVDRWYAQVAAARGQDPADAAGRAELLKRAIFNSKRLRALAERPLLLTLMASLHAWRGGSLPEKREALYADAVALLLDVWEDQRVVRTAAGEIVVRQKSLSEYLQAGRDKVRALLDQLAYEAHAGQPEATGTADIPEQALLSGLLTLSENPDVRPQRAIEYLRDRAGLLLPRGVGVYTFPHRTFQEYLAASYLSNYGYPDRVADLARSQPNRWREVALLAAAKTARGGAFALWPLVDELCHKEPETSPTLDDQWGAHLAAQAIVEIADLDHLRERQQATVARVRRWLVHVMHAGRLPAVERALAGRHLAILGDTRREVLDVDTMQFCLVPAGPFWMGDGDEQHLNTTLETDYWIGRWPLTQAQFQQFVAARGYQQADYWREAAAVERWKEGQVQDWASRGWRPAPHDYGPPYNLPNHPIVGLTWYEALAFTRWLTERWQAAGLLSSAGCVRLVSEAEWEKAARGGVQIPAAPTVRPVGECAPGVPVDLVDNPAPKRPYPWLGAFDPDRANGRETNIGTPSGVGCFAHAASPYGCEELAGNVWEWTRSIAEDYPYDPHDGREKTEVKLYHSLGIRGGAYWGEAPECSNATRRRRGPNDRNNSYGVRLVLKLAC